MKGHTMLRQTSFLTRKNCNHLVSSLQSCRKLRTLTIIAQFTALLLFVLAIGAVSVFAQTASSGAIIGTVTDQSGAVVPDAQVALTRLSTNATLKATTNSSGHYAFPNVDPGTYNLKITKQGFQTALVQGQAVEIGKAITEDVKLTVGAVTQEVTVETTGTELQTLNSTVGNTVTGVALDSLPAIGRDVSTFVTLQPGVGPDGSVAGAVVDQSSFTLDGGQNSNDMDGSMNVYTPSFSNDPTGGEIGGGPTGVMPTPIDSIEEFKVNTANQTADFNSSSGAQVQMITRRGRNSYHGTAYEYYLDNNFSANTWQNNHQAVPTPVPDYHYSRFGASFGGPLIPKDVLGGKTYFFGNYQGFRWPNSATLDRATPTDSFRLGLIFDSGSHQYFNMNPVPVTFKGVTYQPAACPGTANGLCDPRGIGMSPLVSQVWSKFMPLPTTNNCIVSRCDTNSSGQGNVGDFQANLALPQDDNFGVLRLDHDFGDRNHFNATYHYYHLTRATSDQVDIGGFFSGDKLGTPSSLSNRPQNPWLYTAGLTTNLSSNLTNDLHYSFLRNYWAWGTQNAPVQAAGLGAAIEPFGETATAALIPFNVNAQQTRTRFWDGQDHFLRDDLTLLHGNHLFQFGGAYQHNFNYHQRTDNGGGINYTPVYQLGLTTGSGISGVPTPTGYTGSTTTLGRDYAALLGIVSVSQTAYTRSGPTLALNPPLTPAFDKSTIPYYNVYFSDSWHLKPSVTLTYGLGWTLEMPPTEQNGKQVEFVDQANQPIDTEAYLASRERAALQGQVYNPQVGFALIGNTANSPKYPYDPFYGSFSPRVAVAWNPDFGDSGILGKLAGGKNSVIRGGYGRIYGRLNGVDLVLVPLLGTGLIQPVQCKGALNPAGASANGGNPCGGAGGANPSNAFRVGPDGLVAPLPAAQATLPQPFFPGIGANTEAGAGEALDPHFRPNVVDSFDLSIQRQFSSRITMEFGYIGRRITHEYQPINVNAVPYMMTLGGQRFDKAYAAVETALGCTISVNACGAGGVPATIAPQPFFEAALAGTGYCTGFASCTAAVVKNEFSNFTNQDVWDLWSDLDNGGTAAGFNFPHSMLNTAGQLSSGVGINASVGYGNYNAAFVTLRTSDWRGLTAQQNFTWGKANGTGAAVQATSEFTPDDPFNLGTMYGNQSFDRKYVYNLFMVYQPPYFKNQQGVVGHLLGGWTLAPIFTAGSGAPMELNTISGDSEAYGAGDQTNFFNNENGVFVSNQPIGSSSAHYNVAGSAGVGTSNSLGLNIFSNPATVFNSIRNPILGLDTKDGGFGVLRGLPYWNLDLSMRKNFRITERISTEAQVIFTNVLNHFQPADPSFSGDNVDLQNPANFGNIPGQGNNPRSMEFGLRVIF